MCGIIGAVAKQNVETSLIAGLKRLEYRGYDSAGIAIIDPHQHLQRIRTKGKIQELQRLLAIQHLLGTTGIAHTRWATHGIPSEKNAHPHMAGKQIAIVHNGILDNFQQIKADLLAQGAPLESDTDSELIAHLIYQKIQSGQTLLKAVSDTVKELTGAFAIGVIDSLEPEHMIAVRKGSPLVIGMGTEGNYIASDIIALLPITKRFIYLQEGDIADIYQDKVMIYDEGGKLARRKIHRISTHYEVASKGHYQHYMLKEIFEQPKAAQAVLSGRVTPTQVLPQIFGSVAPAILAEIKRIQIVACGTSYHAGMVGKYWLEAIGHLPCQVDIASEYRYRRPILEPKTLFLTLSQSGETADTLAALRLAKQNRNIPTLTICNVANSSIVRESQLVFLTQAGPEIGVASTKAFTTQLIALLLLSLALHHEHARDATLTKPLLDELNHLPAILAQALNLAPSIEALAKNFTNKIHTLFLGRGIMYPIALEGALKLKEISYLHAEGYAAGELKHGPLALVDANIPIIVLAPNNFLLDKLKANMQEVLARGGNMLVFTDNTSNMTHHPQINTILMPTVSEMIAPIIYAIPMQLLAYYIAVMKKTDVDQPRNLAKSVTVE